MLDEWIIAITGASGTIYGCRLLNVILGNIPTVRVHLILSEAGKEVLCQEQGWGLEFNSGFEAMVEPTYRDRVTTYDNREIGAAIASGSYRTLGMVIVPCSMNTLAAVANGLAGNLLQRSADVMIKESRKLLLVPRETPLSAIHLENMLKLARVGAKIIPAMPGFYNRPKAIDDLVDHVVMRIVDNMGYAIDIAARWPKVEQG
ncbi:MAG: UbiX family flavin prenyltransferase [Deltaproteobacteria bacterium]|nr:UbiX family flavin prenyltransferase [Deltaproteobacteria bacterium]